MPVVSSPKAATSRALRRSSPHTNGDHVAVASTAGRQGGELVGADVELAVAEAVDPQHLGMDPVGLGAGQGDHPRDEEGGVERGAELAEVDAVAEVGGSRGEDVPAGERRPGCLAGG